MSDQLTKEEQYEKEREEAYLKLSGQGAPDTEHGGEKGDSIPGGKPPPAENPPAAGDGASQGTDTKPEGDKPTTSEVAETPAQELERLRAEVRRLEKVAHDNQAWGTRERQKAAEFEKRIAAIESDRKAEKLEAGKPKILDEFPELEEGVKHVLEKHGIAASPGAVPDPNPAKQAEAGGGGSEPPGDTNGYDGWHKGVLAAHPDFDALSRDPVFFARVQAKLNAAGADSRNPIHAIDEVNKWKAEQATARAKAEEEKKRNLDAMKVPVGGGAKPQGSSPQKQETTEDISFEEVRKKRELIYNS